MGMGMEQVWHDPLFYASWVVDQVSMYVNLDITTQFSVIIHRIAPGSQTSSVTAP